MDITTTPPPKIEDEKLLLRKDNGAVSGFGKLIGIFFGVVFGLLFFGGLVSVLFSKFVEKKQAQQKRKRQQNMRKMRR